MQFPLKPTSRYKREDAYFVEELMFTWVMTCPILDWSWQERSVETAWWEIGLFLLRDQLHGHIYCSLRSLHNVQCCDCVVAYWPVATGWSDCICICPVENSQQQPYCSEHWANITAVTVKAGRSWPPKEKRLIKFASVNHLNTSCSRPYKWPRPFWQPVTLLAVTFLLLFAVCKSSHSPPVAPQRPQFKLNPSCPWSSLQMRLSTVLRSKLDFIIRHMHVSQSAAQVYNPLCRKAGNHYSVPKGSFTPQPFWFSVLEMEKKTPIQLWRGLYSLTVFSSI